MSKVNPSVKKETTLSVRLAGGFGAKAAKQDNESLLRRAVLACLLWEDLAYESGASNSENISTLIPKVSPQVVAEIAVEARLVQKLRHVPLFIASEMLKYPEHKKLVGNLLPQIITRADQITDFVAIYWKGGKKPLAAQAKKGLAACFNQFNEYQFAKYDRDGEVKLRDVYFLVHPKAKDQETYGLFDRLAKRELKVPDTWEVALSGGADKKETFTRLIEDKKLGSLALLRNLRNMVQAGVNSNVIRKGLKEAKSQMLLPLNFFSAAKHASEYKQDINEMMLRTYANLRKIPGYSVFVVDVSGSMGAQVSSKSEFSRQHVAAAMATLALEICEEVDIYCTAGSDGGGKHQTALIPHPKRGFDLVDQINEYAYQGRKSLGGGGIFTRQCLEYIKGQVTKTPDRIIVFSDSQDCDRGDKIPSPFGEYNYIVDVSSHAHGINYKGRWDAEITGFSENFLTFIAGFEGLENQFED